MLETFFHSFVNRPLQDITFEIYKHEVSLIHVYTNTDPIDVEWKLRNAIKAKHSENFNQLIEEFHNPNSPRRIRIKNGIEAALHYEKNFIQAEIAELRGSNGFNGHIDQAYQEMTQAREEMLQAGTSLTATMSLLTSSFNELSNDLSSLLGSLFSSEHSSAGGGISFSHFQQFTNNYSRARDIYEGTHEIYENLMTRFNSLVQYEPGTDHIIGGRIVEIDAALTETALLSAAEQQGRKWSSFYYELSLDVNEDNKASRYTVLHHIID
jgi:hypothetical protein